MQCACSEASTGDATVLLASAGSRAAPPFFAQSPTMKTPPSFVSEIGATNAYGKKDSQYVSCSLK